MQTIVRQLFASASADADNAANLQFVKKGLITAVRIAVRVDADTNGAAFYTECSFFPSSQATVNDPNGPLITLLGLNNLATSGMTCNAFTDSVSGIAIPVEPGMKAYINVDVTGTITVNTIVQLYVTTP